MITTQRNSTGAMFSIVDAALRGVTQTVVYNETLMNDPGIRKSDAELEGLLRRVRQLDEALSNELDETTASCEVDYLNTGIAIGLQIAEAFRTVAADPLAFQKYVFGRMNGREAEN